MFALYIKLSENWWKEAGVFTSREEIEIFLRNLSYEKDILDYEVTPV